MSRRCFFVHGTKGLLIAIVWLTLISIYPVDVQAQTTGTIYGTVSDPQGSVLPGATVTATNLQTNLKRTETTQTGGSYTLTLLPVGRYSILVEAQGFTPSTREAVDLQVEANLRLDFTLQLGGVSGHVVVTGGTPQVETASATLGKVVEEKRIVDLPLNGRNFLQLGVLQAGVAPPTAGIDAVASGTNNTPGGTAFNFSVNGMRITSNNHLLDGVNNVDPITGAAMIVPSPDMLQEFRILTNMYSAEYGRAGGSIVTVITKGGGNQFHGSAYEFLRNDKFDARNFFAPLVPALKQNQFGFALGGPVLKGKTFFFGGYEGFRQVKGIPVFAPVPTLAERRGDFSQDPIKPINPLTRQPYPGNQVPINSVSQNIMNLWPAPNSGSNIWTATPSGFNHRNQFTGRVDHTLSSSDAFSARYILDQGTRFLPLGHFASNAAPNIQVPGFGNEDVNRFQNFAVADVHTFLPTLINEIRFSYQRSNVGTGKPVNQVDRNSLGFTFPLASTLQVAPIIAVSGITGLGPPSFSKRVNNFYELVDNVSFITNKHTMKLGLDIRRTHVDSLYTSLGQGAFSFNGLSTGNAFADFVIGAPFLFLQAGGKETKTLTQTATYLFFQDDYHVTRDMTLNLGLRYELSPGFTEKNNQLLTFVPGAQSVLGPTLPPGLVHAGDPGVPRTIFSTYKKAFAPRFGIAWDPFGDGMTSVRAGYGLFYDDSSLLQTETVQQPPDLQPIQVLIFPRSFADPFQGKSPFTPPVTFPLAVGPGTTVTWIARDFRPAYIQQWNLTLQRQLTSSLAVEVAYVGNKGTRLQGSVDVNQPVIAPGLNSRNVAQFRPYPLLGSTFQATSVFNSNYHGLQTTVTERLSHGLTFQAAYTWSKAMDQTTQPSAFFLIPGQNAGRPENSRNLRAESGLSAFDLRHRFVVSYIYELPFFRNGRGKTASLLGGWRLSGIGALQSGHPFTTTDSLDPNLDSVQENDRDNVLRNPNLPPGQGTVQQWFDTSAFVRPAIPGNGNAGRNILIGPRLVNFDMGLDKQFNLSEQRRIEFRWEVFNIFNHTNLGTPVNDFNSRLFGQIQNTASPERQMQFALKFIF